MRVEVRDPLGRTQLVDMSSLLISQAAERRVKWSFPQGEGVWSVMIAHRSSKCLVANDHEPRRWIVCATGLLLAPLKDKTIGSSALTHITFHERLGGPQGAIVRAGLLLDELSAGEA